MDIANAEQLAQLRCLQCNGYLSYFPIYHSYNSQGSICGRCTVEDNTNRNFAYEAIAALYKFPCRYYTNGCLDNLHPNEIPRHEEFCKFRKYDCPTINSTKCKWRGLSSDIWDHVQTNHAIFAIRGDEFEVDFVGKYTENYLLNFENEIYIVKESSKNNKFSCTIHYIGSNIFAINYSYKLTFQNVTKRDINIVITKTLEEETLIEKKFIVDSLKNPMGVIARIEILKPVEEDNEKYEEVQWNLIGELECCCCMEYMLPPVQQCIVGHSICFNCKQTQNVCPTCNGEFENTVNITLGNLIDLLIYPCKYTPDGCNFTCKATDIRKHESNCTFGKIKCPLNDYEGCKEEIPYSKLYDHILNKHYENLLEMDVVTRPLKTQNSDYDSDEGSDDDEIRKENEDCFILRYNFRLFKLHFKHEFGNFYWDMQLIGVPKSNEEYEFEINFRDNKRRVCFRRECNALCNKDELFGDTDDSYIFVDIDQIQNMIKDELLTYQVRILPKL